MKKNIALIVSSLIVAGLITFSWLVSFPLVWQIIFTVYLSLALVGIYLGAFVFKRIFKTMVLVLIIGVLVIGVYSALFYSGLLEHFSSKEAAQAWFESFGAWAWVIFFLIELAQVLVIPVPAQITTVAGVFMLGPWKAFLISEVAIISGSIIAFALGKIFGDKIAYKIAKKETVEKYKNILTRKGILLLPIMFLFPLFPDDLLCFLAGSTAMSWSYFIFVTLVTRTIGIACTCFFLSGTIIPFSGWGIPVWIVIVIVLVTACIFLFKYQVKITDWIIEKFGRKTKLDKLKEKRQQKHNSKEVENKDAKGQQKISEDKVVDNQKNENIKNEEATSNKKQNKKQKTKNIKNIDKKAA